MVERSRPANAAGRRQTRLGILDSHPALDLWEATEAGQREQRVFQPARGPVLRRTSASSAKALRLQGAIQVHARAHWAELHRTQVSFGLTFYLGGVQMEATWELELGKHRQPRPCLGVGTHQPSSSPSQ